MGCGLYGARLGSMGQDGGQGCALWGVMWALWRRAVLYGSGCELYGAGLGSMGQDVSSMGRDAGPMGHGGALWGGAVGGRSHC